MFCSTVIATINRPSLRSAVLSVLNQNFTADDHEVIVVNDTGSPLPEMDWQHSERVCIVSTYRRKGCVARNTGAALARGKWLYFLDDDNLMLPGALRSFWELDRTAKAAWLYGGYQVMDDDGNVLQEIHSGVTGDILALLVAGELIPLPASLLRTDLFFAAGAFDTSFVSIAEDIDLEQRLALLGDVAGSESVVAQIRGGREGSSANWSHFSEIERQAREKVFNRPGIFGRLQTSAKTSSYLRGRVARVYLASLQWNLGHRNILVAGSRFASCLRLSGPHVSSKHYWRGLRRRATG